MLQEIQVPGESRLIFVHQTKFQSRLLERYGNSVGLLDATYKTTKYLLPLFFVVVKTNVDYQAVSSFVVPQETRAATTEALRIIKKRNPKWDPKCFISDNCDEEIKSVGNIIPREYIYFKEMKVCVIFAKTNCCKTLGF